jgi:hypothetical protein
MDGKNGQKKIRFNYRLRDGNNGRQKRSDLINTSEKARMDDKKGAI